MYLNGFDFYRQNQCQINVGQKSNKSWTRCSNTFQYDSTFFGTKEKLYVSRVLTDLNLIRLPFDTLSFLFNVAKHSTAFLVLPNFHSC